MRCTYYFLGCAEPGCRTVPVEVEAWDTADLKRKIKYPPVCRRHTAKYMTVLYVLKAAFEDIYRIERQHGEEVALSMIEPCDAPAD